MDKRWQLVLGGLGTTEAPFSQGVLVTFRARALLLTISIRNSLHRGPSKLAKHPPALAGSRLQAALDSSPLLGAGRIEDTWNLIGRALRPPW